MNRTLKARFESVVNDYIYKFTKKHEIEFDYWIGGDVGEMAIFNEQYAFHFGTIKYDIDNNVDKRHLFNWYYLYNTAKKGYIFRWHKLNNGYKISYKNYVLGLRPKHIIDSERRESLERSKMNVERTKEILENLIKE